MRKTLIDRFPIFVTGLFLIQPLMDALSFWIEKLNGPGTVTLLLRLAVLGATVLLGFFLSDRKWIYWVAAGFCAVLFGGHVWACMQVGYGDPIGDLTNYIRVLQMPVTVLCLITFFRSNDKCFEAMQVGLTLALTEILLIEAISVVTGTDPHTYDNGHGVLGWFNNSNSQSNNLSVLLPISLAWQLTWKKRRPVVFWMTAAGGLSALYFMCPRLAYLGILAITAGLGISLLLISRTNWRMSMALAAVCVMYVCLFPVSPLGHHMDNGNSYESNRQTELVDTLGEDVEKVKSLAHRMRTEKDLTEDEYAFLVASLKPIYEECIGDFVEYFGLEETMELYDYSMDYLKFTALRPKKLLFAEHLMEMSPVSARIFGLELSRFQVGHRIYDVENDFHGIYYLYGIVGLIAYLSFIAYFLWIIAWALIRNAKRYFTVEAAGYGIALVMCLIHACTTSGVLRRPNASIYLSAILAAVYYLVKLKKYDEPAESL